MKLSSYTYIGETIFSGVKFYRYQRGFLHQKVMLVDDEFDIDECRRAMQA